MFDDDGVFYDYDKEILYLRSELFKRIIRMEVTNSASQAIHAANSIQDQNTTADFRD